MPDIGRNATEIGQVDLCRNAADRCAVAVGDEELRLPHFEERAMLAREPTLFEQVQRRHEGVMAAMRDVLHP
ncbi:hypothetical protein D9M68_995810 [compost metagenome]